MILPFNEQKAVPDVVNLFKYLYFSLASSTYMACLLMLQNTSYAHCFITYSGIAN